VVGVSGSYGQPTADSHRKRGEVRTEQAKRESHRPGRSEWTGPTSHHEGPLAEISWDSERFSTPVKTSAWGPATIAVEEAMPIPHRSPAMTLESIARQAIAAVVTKRYRFSGQ
jgi:hypothetical protein